MCLQTKKGIFLSLFHQQICSQHFTLSFLPLSLPLSLSLSRQQSFFACAWRRQFVHFIRLFPFYSPPIEYARHRRRSIPVHYLHFSLILWVVDFDLYSVTCLFGFVWLHSFLCFRSLIDIWLSLWLVLTQLPPNLLSFWFLIGIKEDRMDMTLRNRWIWSTFRTLTRLSCQVRCPSPPSKRYFGF